MSARRLMVVIDEEKCDGCGDCVPSCHEGAIRIINGKAKLLDEALCDGLGACLGECPQGAITLVEKDAKPFAGPPQVVEHGCPGSVPQHACPGSVPQPRAAAPRPAGPVRLPGAVPSTPAWDANRPQWPVQIALVSSRAPYLAGRELLVAADCVPIACRTFHQDFMDGRSVMIGCPKFDDLDEYVARFAQLFREADVTAVDVVVMEVPCCSALPVAVARGMAASGRRVPLTRSIVGVDGTLLAREPMTF